MVMTLWMHRLEERAGEIETERCVYAYMCIYIYIYLMAAANAADPKTERNRLGGSGRVGPSRAE